MLNVHNKYFFLFFFIVGVSVECLGFIYSDSNKCYDIRLKGSIIDISSCQQTMVRLKEVDCQSKKVLSDNDVAAQLKNCTPNSAKGTLLLNNKPVEFNARLSQNAAFESWTLSRVHNPRTTSAAQKNIVSKSKTDKDLNKEKLKQAPPPSEEPTQSLEKQNIRLNIYTEIYYRYEFDGKHENTALNPLTTFHLNDSRVNEVSIGQISPIFRYRTKDSIFVFESTFGDTANWVARSNKLGEEQSHIHQAYYRFNTDHWTFSFGKENTFLMTESLFAGKNNFYSFGLNEAYAIPRFHTGFKIDYQLEDNLVLHASVGNGWNTEHKNTDQHLTIIGLNYNYSKNLELSTAMATTGDLNEADTKTVKNVYYLFGKYHLFWKLSGKTSLISGTSSREFDGTDYFEGAWSSLQQVITYTLNPRHLISLRYETLDHKNGFLLPGEYGKSWKSITLSYRTLFKPGSVLFFEVRQDESDQNCFETSKGDFKNSKISLLTALALYF